MNLCSPVGKVLTYGSILTASTAALASTAKMGTSSVGSATTSAAKYNGTSCNIHKCNQDKILNFNIVRPTGHITILYVNDMRWYIAFL